MKPSETVETDESVGVFLFFKIDFFFFFFCFGKIPGSLKEGSTLETTAETRNGKDGRKMFCRKNIKQINNSACFLVKRGKKATQTHAELFSPIYFISFS